MKSETFVYFKAGLKPFMQMLLTTIGFLAAIVAAYYLLMPYITTFGAWLFRIFSSIPRNENDELQLGMMAIIITLIIGAAMILLLAQVYYYICSLGRVALNEK